MAARVFSNIISVCSSDAGHNFAARQQYPQTEGEQRPHRTNAKSRRSAHAATSCRGAAPPSTVSSKENQQRAADQRAEKRQGDQKAEIKRKTDNGIGVIPKPAHQAPGRVQYPRRRCSAASRAAHEALEKIESGKTPSAHKSRPGARQRVAIRQIEGRESGARPKSESRKTTAG